MTRYAAGVDGGGTATRVAIADEHGRVLGQGTAGTSNHDDVPPAEVAENLERALQEALTVASLATDQRVDSAFLGLAGVVSERDRRRIRSIVASTRLAACPQVEIDHDIRIALAGGLAGRPGVVLVSGTGSSCYGRTADARSWQSGGWGQLLADEGSGYWLGVRGLQAAMRMLDGRMPRSSLAEALLEELEVASGAEVMHRVYVDGMSRSSLAALAPVVLTHAQEGDVACLALVSEGAEELVRCIEAVAHELELAGTPFEVTFTGSILESAPLMREAVSTRLEWVLPTARLVEPELPPALGACVLALANLHLDMHVVTSNVVATAPKL